MNADDVESIRWKAMATTRAPKQAKLQPDTIDSSLPDTNGTKNQKERGVQQNTIIH